VQASVCTGGGITPAWDERQQSPHPAPPGGGLRWSLPSLDRERAAGYRAQPGVWWLL